MVFTRFFDGNNLPFKQQEALRYFGVKGDVDERAKTVFLDCVKEGLTVCDYKVCYAVFSIKRVKNTRGENVLDLGFLTTDSEDLRRNLEGCNSVVAFAATVGIGIDRLITRHSSISPVKSYAYQAIGAERIEALCNAFNEQITADYEQRGLGTKPRFSCGYGDFSLEYQPAFFKALDVERKIGLTLTDGLLMSPTKSVTALIGITGTPCNADGQANNKCRLCKQENCQFSLKGDTHAKE